jgi:hypothetical protein
MSIGVSYLGGVGRSSRTRRSPRGYVCDAEEERLYIISCRPDSQEGLGGYAHNDLLSFGVCMGRDDFVTNLKTYRPKSLVRNAKTASDR